MTKTNTRSRIVSILLVLVMLLTMVPITGVTANAADTSWTTVNTYDQLKAALSNQNPPDNIKLGSDIDTGTLTSGMGIIEPLEVKGRKQLDLNGHTLRMYSAKTAMSDMITIRRGDLTVLDSSSGQKGTILGSTYNDSCYLFDIQYGKLTLNSGTLKVDAGSLKTENKWRRVIYCYVGGTVTINGGTFQGPVRLDAGGSDWKENEPRIQINGGTFEKKVMLNGSGDGTKPLTVINNGIFLDYVQAWVAASFENSFSTHEVVINGGEFHKKFWMRPTFVDKNDKDLTGYHVAVKLNGGTIHETLSVDKQPSDYGYAPVRPRLSYSDVTFLASEMLGGNAVQTGKGTFAAQDTSSYREYIPYYDYNKSKRWSEGFVFEIKAVNDQPTKILSNAWGMKSVTLDGNPIDYFKNWKGTFENLNNDEAHTLKFEWYPLAQELKDAGYSYRAECDRYISGSSAVQQTDIIAADKTSHTVTIPAGADPKVYSYDLQLNLQKDGSYVGIFVNQHIVKLVVNEAPVVEPDPTIEGSVYYTSGIVFGRSISTAASVTPAEATKSCQWQRSTNGGSTWTNIEGATRGSYTPVAADMGENVRIRVVVTAEGYLGEIVGAAVKVSKAANNNYPAVIQLEAVKNGAGNYTGFEITNFDSDYEYVYSMTSTPDWSANQITSATVTGLTSDTTYYVFARFKETATHTAGSIVSSNSIRLYDYVPLDRVLLEGYGSYGTIYIKKGESVELKVNADPSNANSWKEITFKDEGATTSNIAISNGKINASTGTATPFPNGHTITITGVSKGSANLRASYPSATSSAYGTWYVVVYDDSTVANALRLESVYAYEDITLSENDEAELPTELPKLLPENSGYHLEWRIVKVGLYGASYKTSDDNITLENGKIKPKAVHTGSANTRLELVAVKEGVTNVKSFSQTSRINVTVTEAPTVELTGVTVAPTKVNLELNATYQLSAVKEPVNASGSLNWESSNTGVATVDSTGKVTAKAQGTAIITVSCGNKKATCTVMVDHQHDYSGQPYLYLDPGNHYQECKAGDGYNIQAHEFTPWTDNGNGTHSHHCTVCKMTDGSTYTETAEHTWIWVVDQEAALNQPGKQHEECTGCHAKRSENTEIPALRDYAVTVTGGAATVATGTTITRAKEGVEVTVTAQAPDGKHFVKWVVKAGGVTLANETSATTTFIMPGNDVKIEATYKDASPSHSVYVGMTYTAGNLIYQITSIDTATVGQSKVIGVVAAKKNKIKKVTIPDRADCKGYRLNVTTIGNNAFAGCKALEKLTIGNKVTVIGKNAFKNCSKLKTVVIGKAVKTISSKAFIGDNKIKKITFKGDKLKTVKKNAFSKKAKKNIKSKKTKLKGNKKAIKLFKKKLKIK